MSAHWFGVARVVVLAGCTQKPLPGGDRSKERPGTSSTLWATGLGRCLGRAPRRIRDEKNRDTVAATTLA